MAKPHRVLSAIKVSFLMNAEWRPEANHCSVLYSNGWMIASCSKRYDGYFEWTARGENGLVSGVARDERTAQSAAVAHLALPGRNSR